MHRGAGRAHGPRRRPHAARDGVSRRRAPSCAHRRCGGCYQPRSNGRSTPIEAAVPSISACDRASGINRRSRRYTSVAKAANGTSVPYRSQPAAYTPPSMNSRLGGMSSNASSASRPRRFRSKPTRSNRRMPSRRVSRQSSARHPASINVPYRAAKARRHAMEPAILARRTRPRRRLVLRRRRRYVRTA